MSDSDSIDGSAQEAASTKRRSLRSRPSLAAQPTTPKRRPTTVKSFRQESSDEDEQPSNSKRKKATETSYTPEREEINSGSESDYSDDSEDEDPLFRKRRTSKRLSPQKNQAGGIQSFPRDSSDESDEPVMKRTRTSFRAGTQSETTDREPEVPSPARAAGYASVSVNASPTRSAMKSRANSERLQVSAEEEYPEEEPEPSSPKKVSFLTTPLRPTINGAARTTPKQVELGLEGSLISNLIQSVKINTAMMGDLAAEVRLLRDAIAGQNRKS